MKFIITIFLTLFLCGNAFALPDKFIVYLSSGIRNTVCRNLMTIYAKEYNAEIIFAIKVGVQGELALVDMYKNPEFSVLCSGFSESVFNNALYPGNEDAHAALVQVAMITNTQTSFYTRIDSKYNNILEVIKDCKPVMMGEHITTAVYITDLMFGKCPITYVPYKSPLDSASSLIDGSLDIFSDSNSLETIALAGRLKSIGRINPSPNTQGPDVTKYFPEVAKIKRFISIATSSRNKKEDIEELNRRLRPIIRSAEYYPTIENVGSVMDTSVEEANAIVKTARNIISNIDKQHATK